MDDDNKIAQALSAAKGYAPATLASINRRGQILDPTTPDPTPEELAAARADTRVGGDIVNQRLNTIVPESSRVVGGRYTPGAPGGGRWADLSPEFLNQPGRGFKMTDDIRVASKMRDHAQQMLERAPDVQKEMHARNLQSAQQQLESAYAGGDQVLQRLWGESLAESSEAARRAAHAHNVKPTFGAKDWDKAMSLPLKDHLWYELSGEKMGENLSELHPHEFMKAMDLVGATSARAEPGENLERALAVLSQHMRGAPADVDLTIPSTVNQALSRKAGTSSALPGNKTGSFSDTLTVTGGVPTKFPISVNDVWVGKMFGVPDDVMSSNQSLHEPMAMFFNKLRDHYNEMHKVDAPFKYQSWNFQAPAWVHLRNKDAGAISGDAYHQVWGNIINKLNRANVPGIVGDKISRQALMHPDFADALRGTTAAWRNAPKATVEFGTTQTPVGAAAHKLYQQAIASGDNLSQQQYLKGLTAAMYQSARGQDHPWEVLKKAITGDITKRSDITRIASPTSEAPLDIGGTFEGSVSPNIRIPLKDMTPEQIEMFNAISGMHLKQDAMAASTILHQPHGSNPTQDHIRGHSLFVPTTNQISPDHIRDFVREMAKYKHDMSYARYPNGYKFDILPNFTGDIPKGADEQDIMSAYKASLEPHYGTPKVLQHDFQSVYTPHPDYRDLRQKLVKGIQDDFLKAAQEGGLEKSAARQILKGADLPKNVTGRSRKAWDTYRARIDYLARAEQGFKDLAKRVESAHRAFIPAAMKRSGLPYAPAPLPVQPRKKALFNSGGAVQKAMSIASKFGSDAVQKAVRASRQHTRGRP